MRRFLFFSRKLRLLTKLRGPNRYRSCGSRVLQRPLVAYAQFRHFFYDLTDMKPVTALTSTTPSTFAPLISSTDTSPGAMVARDRNMAKIIAGYVVGAPYIKTMATARTLASLRLATPAFRDAGNELLNATIDRIESYVRDDMELTTEVNLRLARRRCTGGPGNVNARHDALEKKFTDGALRYEDDLVRSGRAFLAAVFQRGPVKHGIPRLMHPRRDAERLLDCAARYQHEFLSYLAGGTYGLDALEKLADAHPLRSPGFDKEDALRQMAMDFGAAGSLANVRLLLDTGKVPLNFVGTPHRDVLDFWDPDHPLDESFDPSAREGLLHLAVIHGTPADVSDMLDRLKQADTYLIGQGWIRKGNPGCISVDYRNGLTHSALHVAAAEGNVEACRLLLQHGADLNARTSGGSSALHMAQAPAVIRLLLEHGADIQALDRKGNTPLHSKHSVAAISFLLKQGADRNALNERGQTVVHGWIRYGDNDFDLKAAIQQLQLASSHGQEPFDFVKLLDHRDARGNTAWHDYVSESVSLPHLEKAVALIRYLKSEGIDIQARDGNNCSLPDLADQMMQRCEPETSSNYQSKLKCLIELKRLVNPGT